VIINALGAANQKALRTQKSRAFEGKSLRSIAAEVAQTHNLTLVGMVPDITWRRATQHRESDLAFLSRLGEEHGLVFSVKGDKLVFHEIQKLEAQRPLLKLVKSDLSEYRFREKVVAGAASASYFNGDLKELHAVEVVEQEHRHPDKKKVRRRTENKAQAQRLAKMALRTQKAWERDATLTLPGDTRLVAGGTFELTGFGKMDGLWLTRSARHRVVRNHGYTVELEARHVAQ
jgi:phage protein D